MVFPVIFFPSIIIPSGDIALLLADAIQIPYFSGASSSADNLIVGVPDDAIVKRLDQKTVISVLGNSLSVHNQKTDADYQTPASGTTKIILTITVNAAAADLKFKVWSHDISDTTPGSGTPEYDLTTDKLDASGRQTTIIMTGFGTSKFVNVELESATSGVISDIEGWVVEIHA